MGRETDTCFTSNDRKPNPAFYQIALDKLGVQAEETIFLDDIGM